MDAKTLWFLCLFTILEFLLLLFHVPLWLGLAHQIMVLLLTKHIDVCIGFQNKF